MLDSYTSEEILATPLDAWPEKGLYCPRCKMFIPVFADMDEATEARLRKLRSKDKVRAMKEIREQTGCSLRWAKIWAIHPNGPNEPLPDRTGGPCPYCGDQLATNRAKQCFSCGMDWHDKKNPIRRGSDA